MCTQACTQNESRFSKPYNHAGLKTYFVSKSSLAAKWRVRGFRWLWRYAVRFGMENAEAKRKQRVLMFWEKHGLAVTVWEPFWLIDTRACPVHTICA